MSAETVDEIFKCCDTDGDQRVTSKEFKKGFAMWFKQKGAQVPSDDHLTIMFEGINTAGDDDIITKDELRKQLVSAKDRITGLKADFKAADTQGGGDGLSKEEFLTFVKKHNVISADKAEGYVDVQFRISDTDNTGKLNFEEFQDFMDNCFGK